MRAQARRAEEADAGTSETRPNAASARKSPAPFGLRRRARAWLEWAASEQGQSSVEFALIISLISVPLFILTWRLLRFFVWMMVQQIVANFTGVPPP